MNLVRYDRFLGPEGVENLENVVAALVLEAPGQGHPRQSQASLDPYLVINLVCE